jgi:hypothetical protein
MGHGWGTRTCRQETVNVSQIELSEPLTWAKTILARGDLSRSQFRFNV